MSRQAQAERERQARVILGESEKQIADSFRQASLAYVDNPTALHLRAMNMLFEGLLVQLIGWGCWGCCYGLSFIPIIANVEKYKDAPPPAFFFISLGLMVVPLGLMGLWMLYGLWGAWRAFQGRDFRYIVLGRMLERYLGLEGKANE
jgi:hypothetical protein